MATAQKSSIFDLLNGLTSLKTPWEELPEDAKKMWSTFMINRWLSMDADLLPIVDMIQQCTAKMPNEMVYKLYLDILPKQKFYLKYIKRTKTARFKDELIGVIKQHYLVGKWEAIRILEDYFETDEGKTVVVDILERHGVSPKEVKEYMKQTKVGT